MPPFIAYNIDKFLEKSNGRSFIANPPPKGLAIKLVKLTTAQILSLTSDQIDALQGTSLIQYLNY